MNLHLLNIESQDFINAHLNSDVSSLILKGHTIEGIDLKELIVQIESKKRCQKKLPSWFHQENIYYPNKLNIEQTSSEITANYKASLISGRALLDLTGGFGVDAFYFSRQFESVTHCEINEELSNIVCHNFTQFGIETIETLAGDGLEYLKTSEKTFDWIYADPSRRHDAKGKVFFLNDCTPNIPDNLKLIFKHSKNVMVKTSPLLDITAGMEELEHVKTIHVIAIENEVKELIWSLEKGCQSPIRIETINIKSYGNEIFTFNPNDESAANISYTLPLAYLYEPNAAILKAGAFNSVALQFNISKLHKHSHLYTSDLLLDFPGRRFVIHKVIRYNKKAIKDLKLEKANITTRNFPETVQYIRTTYKIKDGGNVYLFFTTNMYDEKVLLLCSKAE